jgi:hypothetical protein
MLTAVSLLWASKPLRYAAIGVAAALAVWAAVLWIEHRGYVAGRDDALKAVEKQDKEAATEAKKWQDAIDECFAAGKEWDVQAGRCN